MNKRVLLYVGFGGMIGTLLRYSLYEWLPWTSIWITLLCNICGSFLLAFLYCYLAAQAKHRASEKLRLFLGVGLLGGFTTFSTVSLEAAQFINNKALLALCLYIGATFIGGFLSTWIGYLLANKSTRKVV